MKGFTKAEWERLATPGCTPEQLAAILTKKIMEMSPLTARSPMRAGVEATINLTVGILAQEGLLNPGMGRYEPEYRG